MTPLAKLLAATCLIVVASTIHFSVIRTEAQTPLVVTVQLNKQQYLPGDTVFVTGKVTEGSQMGPPVGGATVSIQVDDPGGTHVFTSSPLTDTTGSYADSFVVSPSWPVGSYSAFVTAVKAGYSPGMASTNFQAVDEFRVWASVALVAGILGFVIIQRGNRASAKPKILLDPY